MTLQLVLDAWTTTPPDADGRVHVTAAEGSHELAEPGRPMLPAWSTTLALPPGTSAQAHIVASEGELMRTGVALAIAGRPLAREDDSRFGARAALEPAEEIHDGPWPRHMITTSAPFRFRGYRLVQLEVCPFRYQPEQASLETPLRITLRVDFVAQGAPRTHAVAAPAESDPLAAVLAGTVANWQEARLWRERTAAVAAPRRSAERPRPSALRAMVHLAPEVRVKLGPTGLYRLEADPLLANGLPPGIPVAEISVHRHEYVPGAADAQRVSEYAVEIEDHDHDGRFGSGDGIWLWVESWAERTHASHYARWWGDAEVVYVTQEPAGGRRVPHRPAWRGIPGLTPLASYPQLDHHESNSAPMPATVASVADTSLGLWHWTTDLFYYQRPDSIRFESFDADTSHSGTLTVRWVGRREEPHVVWAGFQNTSGVLTTVIDSSTWFGRSAVVRTAAFPGRALAGDPTHAFVQWGKNAFAPPDPARNFFTLTGLDWYELRYWRGFRAVRDLIRFNTADAVGDVQLRVGGFTSDSVRVYDITEPGAPVRVVLDPSHTEVGQELAFEMQERVDSRREYVAAAQLDPLEPGRGPLVPTRASYSPVANCDWSGVIRADYVLVHPRAFATQVAPLAALRRAQGLTVLEAPIECIDDLFGDGRHSALGLQRFLRHAYEHWDTRFVLLAGNGTLDPENLRGTSGPDRIPVLPTPAPFVTEAGVEIVPSDNRYGYLSGNDDPIGSPDTNRVIPELMIGRLSANDASALANMVGKIVAYEQDTGDPAWRRRVLLCSDDAFSGESFFGGGAPAAGYCRREPEEVFVGLNRTAQSFLESDSGVAGLQVQRFDLRSYMPSEPVTFDPLTGDTCRLERDAARSFTRTAVTPVLLGQLNAGQLLWSFQGHANAHVLTHEDLFLGDQHLDALALRNDGRPFLFTAFSCHVNLFAQPETEGRAIPGPCLGADLLALPAGRGAVASWASVAFEIMPRNARDHVSVELARSLFVDPPRDPRPGTPEGGARVVLGEAILAALFRHVGTTINFAPERGIATTYTLLGDPATRIDAGPPALAITVNGRPPGDPVRLHHEGNQLRLAATVASLMRLDSLELWRRTNAGIERIARADYTLTPAFPDTGANSVAGGRRFRLDYETTVAASDADYLVRATDRNGRAAEGRVSLRLDTQLRAGSSRLADDDEVAPNAALSLLLLSPRALSDPARELSLEVNGVAQAFTASPVASDTTAAGVHSGREWVLQWAHADYPADRYEVTLQVAGEATVTRRFRVTEASGRLGVRNLVAFPNPLGPQGTNFSFVLLGSGPADVRVSVFTSSGRRVFERTWPALAPGYQQLPWDGPDAEGHTLANGTYFYSLSARADGAAGVRNVGRLVQLGR